MPRRAGRRRTPDAIAPTRSREPGSYGNRRFSSVENVRGWCSKGPFGGLRPGLPARRPTAGPERGIFTWRGYLHVRRRGDTLFRPRPDRRPPRAAIPRSGTAPPGFLSRRLDDSARSGTEMSDESVRPIHPNQKAGERTTTTAVTGRGVGVVARFGLLGSVCPVRFARFDGSFQFGSIVDRVRATGYRNRTSSFRSSFSRPGAAVPARVTMNRLQEALP
jgi:hypothetical protein